MSTSTTSPSSRVTATLTTASSAATPPASSTTGPPIGGAANRASFDGWRRYDRPQDYEGRSMTLVVAAAAAAIMSGVVGAVFWRPALAGIAVATVVVAGHVTHLPNSGGMSLWTYRRGRAASRRAQRSGRPVYRALAGQAWELPGPLAPTMLTTGIYPGTSRPFGVVVNRATGTLTATVLGSVRASHLVATAVVDGQVGNWHALLAGLGRVPAVRHLAVITELAKDPGTTIGDENAARMHAHAPKVVHDLLTRLVATAEHANAVQTWVAITVDPALLPGASSDASSNAGPESQIAALGVLLHELVGDLIGAGLDIDLDHPVATSTDLAGIVRAAFDPDARGEVQRLRRTGDPDGTLTWGQAGPAAAHARWAQYDHDGAVSVSWEWTKAPQEIHDADVLRQLLTPGPFTRRVALLIRPASDDERELQVKRAVTRARAKRRAAGDMGKELSARASLAERAARRAELSVAHGAGLVRVSLFVTTTVRDHSRLQQARGDVVARVHRCKLRVRQLFGEDQQVAGFLATLPVGLHPHDLAKGVR